MILAFVVLTVAASATVAGPDTPCAELIPGHMLCQLPSELIDMMGFQCIGQIVLLNCMPVLLALLAMSSSRWKSGTHLLTIGLIGAAGGASAALFAAWPSVYDLGTDAPVHLLGAPVVTSVFVLTVVSFEKLAIRCRRHAPAAGEG